MIGSPLAELDTPALVVDLPAFERNLQRMADLVPSGRIRLRPHAKSHKTPAVAERQLKLGAAGVCCAKLGEAEVMIAGGVTDVLITGAVVGGAKAARLANLTRDATVTVAIDCADHLEALQAAAARADARIGILVEVDVGQNRCGVRSSDQAVALAVQAERSSHLIFRGLQGYNGAIQQIADHGERKARAADALGILMDAASSVARTGIEVEILSGGGTGTVPIDLDLGGLNELQPGSYIFMDASYGKISWNAAGSPPPFEPALHVISTVVSRPIADLAVIDAGWKALSSDAGAPMVVDPVAEAFAFGGDEHGKILLNDEGRGLRVGDRVTLRPSHCDTTLNLYDRLIGHRNGIVESVWSIAARGRTD